MPNKAREVELSEEFIVLAIPATTVEVTISAKVWCDGEVVEVKRTMPFDEVRGAIKEAQEGYIPSDAIFVLNKNAASGKIEQLVQTYLDRAENKDEG